MTVSGWLRENLHELRTTDPADDDLTDLEPLRDIVGDASVVAIGESTHRVHEFSAVRHRLTRFLVREMGFTGFVMESGFAEGRMVHDWVLGGPGNLADVARRGITYRMGECTEVHEHLAWMRAAGVRFHGMDISDSSASTRPAVEAVLVVLDAADPAYAERVRKTLLPLYDYLPTDRSGLAWQAPALQAYLDLDDTTRHELTARIGELAERVAAMRVTYAGQVGDEAAAVAVRCAATARHGDAFHAAMAAGPDRTYPGANVRDLAMAENVEWILGREDRIVVAAANGHVQRWPFRVPPFVPEPMTVLGEHLAAALGDRMVVIGSTHGGGTMWRHRPVPGAAPGHTEVFTEDIGPFDDPTALDTLLTGTGVPLGLLDLRRVPAAGPVAERFAALRGVMNGPHVQLLDPLVAFDAVVHVDRVTPWHTLLDVDRTSRGSG